MPLVDDPVNVPSSKRPLVCLTMIVKNEEPIIARCLTKARRLFDRWVIVDTGSTDRTMEIIRETLVDVPGRLVERAWKGFGDAKTTALLHATELMEGQGYALVLDADEIIDGDIPQDLTHDAYALWMQLHSLRYQNVRLFRLERKWRYEGVLHEFPTTDGAWTAKALDVTITSPRDGARAKETDRYKRDIEVLLAALETEDPQSPLAARYMFYLAQTYRDSGDDTKALLHYQRRGSMGAGSNWEEIYISKLEAARCLDRLGQNHQAERMYLDASHTWPDRAEALRAIKRIIDSRLRAAEAKQPVGALFIEDSGSSYDEGFFPITAANKKTHEAFFEGSVTRLREFCLPFREEYAAWPEERSYNGWFEAGDLELYYAVIRSLRPKKIIEIGSGYATHAAVEACARNGHGQIVCIDPQPRADLPKEVQLVKLPVEEVSRSVFDALEGGDLVFIDSSHTAEEALFHCLLLERFPSGVVVQHHDCLYPQPPVFPEETLLMHYYRIQLSSWQGLVSNAIARQALGPVEYGNIVPAYRRNTARFPGSIYTRKR
jgi:glycosyltransferase involved in cell wall biosynthesis